MAEAVEAVVWDALVAVLEGRMGEVIEARESVIRECRGYLRLLADLLGQSETLGIERTLMLARELAEDAIARTERHTLAGA